MTSHPPFAREERRALAETALRLGEDAPTLAGDWTAKDLMCHLLVRERSPWAAPGIRITQLAWLVDREMRRLARTEFAELVARFAAVPALSPLALPQVEATANTLEFFVHHEDLLRAQPEWEPRPLPPYAANALWSTISVVGRFLVRPAGVPVLIRRADADGDTTRTLRAGADPVVLSGPPGEVALFLYGRAQTRQLRFEGPQAAVDRLRGARLGL